MFTRNQPVDTSICDPRTREIARQAVAATIEQLGSTTASMSMSELRGYVRAKAQRVLRALVSDDARADNLLQYVVQHVLDELSSTPTVILPIPHVQRRAA